MLCEPKTGTTVQDWVVRRLYEKTAEEINKCRGIDNVEEAQAEGKSPAVYTTKTEETSVEYMGNQLYFTRHYKHDSYWPDILNRDHIRKVAIRCMNENIPAWSKQCLEHLPDMRGMKENVGDFSIIVTMRDPIAIAMSGLFFAKGELSDSQLNNLMLDSKGCLYIAPYLAIRYSVANILKAYGFDVQLSFYEDFRTEPEKYLYELARFLGLEVEDHIIQEVIEETSISEAKKAQQVSMQHFAERVEIFSDGLADEKGDAVFTRLPLSFCREQQIIMTPVDQRSAEMQTMWRGIGNNPNNYRKVRSGEVRGYVDKLDRATLQKCVDAAKFHLPPELKNRYFGNFSF